MCPSRATVMLPVGINAAAGLAIQTRTVKGMAVELRFSASLTVNVMGKMPAVDGVPLRTP